MNKYQTWEAFWNSFEIPAYDETSVPDDAVPPYITYESAFDDLGEPLGLTASVYYRSTNWKAISSKVAEIETRLKRGGAQVRYDSGSLWITKARPFSQRFTDNENDTIRRYIINVQAEFFD